MRNAGLDEAQAAIKIAGRNINNLILKFSNWTHSVRGDLPPGPVWLMDSDGFQSPADTSALLSHFVLPTCTVVWCGAFPR